MGEYDHHIRELKCDETALAADEVRTRGAVIVREIVPAGLIARLRDDLLRAMDEDHRRFRDAPPFPGMVHALMTRGQSFIDLLCIDAVRQLARAVLGQGAIVHAYNSSSLPPRRPNYTSRVHVDSPRLVPGYITNLGFCFPLDDFTSDNGAMEIWPESFEIENAPDERMFNDRKVVLEGLRAGDAVLFNCRSWHRGGVNSTNEWRMGVTLNTCRAFMRQQFNFPAMISSAVRESLSEDVLRFLGYHVQMPTSMDEFLMPPDRRPYRPGQE